MYTVSMEEVGYSGELVIAVLGRQADPSNLTVYNLGPNERPCLKKKCQSLKKERASAEMQLRLKLTEITRLDSGANLK